jgi:hypothetical protein
MNRTISEVVIVGGGSAGWLSAGIIAKEHPYLSVTLVESNTIPISGVGEGTWPSMRQTLQRIGISEKTFIQQCDVSFKQGSKFVNWRSTEPEENYYHPFMTPEGYYDTDLHSAWRTHYHQQKYADAFNMQSFVCQAALAPKDFNTPEFAAITNYGYHLDAFKFAEFLKQHCCSTLGVKHIIDDVEQVMSNEDGILGLSLRHHSQIHGDFFIDCSGSQSILIGKHFKTPIKPKDNILFNNKAVATHIPYAKPSQHIASATIATAKQSGWIWDIGLPSRRGVGYVFSDKYCDDETAVKELKSYAANTIGLSQAELLSCRFLKFTPGYRESFWIKNAVAIGMAQGFIEPLEASALAMVELSLSLLSEQWPSNFEHMAILSERFNHHITNYWEKAIEFLKLHYVLSERDDSSYWRDHKSPTSIPESLQKQLTLWHYQPPNRFDQSQQYSLFPSASYQYVLYGMGFFTQTRHEAALLHDPHKASHFYQFNRKKIAQCLQTLPSNRALLEHLNKGTHHESTAN